MTEAGVYLGHMDDQIVGTSNGGAVAHAYGINPYFSQNLRSRSAKSLPHLGLTLVFALAVKGQSVARVPACIRIN